MFTHLHGHSHYSLLAGVGKPADIVNKAKSLGMSSIAITDYGAMYGAVEFFEIAKKNGIKAIIGVELFLVQNTKLKDKDEIRNSLVLLAKDLDGYNNLMELVSLANLDNFFEFARIDEELLRKYSKGLICILSGEKNQVTHMIETKENENKIIEVINNYKNIFGEENFFFELLAQDYKKLIKARRTNETFISLGEKTNTKLLIGNNYHYINKEDKDGYEALQCIKEGTLYNNPTRKPLVGDYHILSEEEIIETMLNNKHDEKFVKSLITNNEELVNSINMEIPLGNLFFPKYDSPEEIKKLYQDYEKNLIE